MIKVFLEHHAYKWVVVFSVQGLAALAILILLIRRG